MRLGGILEAAKHPLDGVAIAVEHGEKQVFQKRLAFGGMFGGALFAPILWRTAGFRRAVLVPTTKSDYARRSVM